MTITPGQADRWAQDATDGPWKLNPHGCILVDDGTDDPARTPRLHRHHV